MYGLPVLISLFVCVAFAESIHIAPEFPLDFSVQLCSHQRKQKTHGHMQFFPEPVKYCASIRSSRHRKHLQHDLRGTTSHQTTTRVEWRQLASTRKCSVTFKGYQGEYRLSPDFGAYEECQYSMSRHLYALSEVLARSGANSKSLQFNSTNPECPILSLPTSYTDYISCSLVRHEWYVLDWSSTIRYETFQNGSYGTYWANHTTSYLFQPTDELSRNGTETDWMARLVNIHTRTNGCDRASVLIRLDEHFPGPAAVSVVYRVRHQHNRVHSELITSGALDGWQELSFPLQALQGSHEACALLSAPSLPSLRHKVCRVIVNQLDCPFPISSSASSAFGFTLFIIYIVFH